MSDCTCSPRYAVVYRESDRLLASAFDCETMPVLGCSEVIHEDDCPAHPPSPVRDWAAGPIEPLKTTKAPADPKASGGSVAV